jgi:hypothetical protein
MLGLLLLLAEELVEQLAAALHQDQTTIVGAIGLVVEQTLHALHALAIGRLIAVWPRAPCEVFLTRQSDVHAVERAEKLVGAPQLAKCLENLGLSACLPLDPLVQ